MWARIRTGRKRILPSVIILFSLILLFPPLLYPSESAGNKAHGTEVLEEIKEFRAEVQKMNLIVVKYMAESGKDIDGLLEFKKEAEEDIEELKKKSLFSG